MDFSRRSGVFEPDKLAEMTAAYNAASEELAKASIPFLPEELADLIIALSETSESDAARLAQSAIELIRERNTS